MDGSHVLMWIVRLADTRSDAMQSRFPPGIPRRLPRPTQRPGPARNDRSKSDSLRAGTLTAGGQSTVEEKHGVRHATDMAVIRAAAPADNFQRRKLSREIGMEHSKFFGVPVVQGFCLVEFRMAQPRCVRTDTADAAAPDFVGQNVTEVLGMCAVDHVIERRFLGGRIRLEHGPRRAAFRPASVHRSPP